MAGPGRLLTTQGLEEPEVKALLEIASAVAAILDPIRVGQLAVDHARQLLDVDGAHLWLWDAEGQALRSFARDDRMANGILDFESRAESIVGQVFRRREPIVVDDYQHWEYAVQSVLRSGVASAMGVPLLVNDRPVGVIVVHNYNRRSFSGHQVQLLSLFAAQMGPALEAARLYDESQRRRTEAEALAELVRMGAAERDAERVIGLICARAGSLVEADYGSVALVETDGNSRLRLGMWGNRSTDWHRRSRNRGTGAEGRALRERRTIIIENVGEDPATTPASHLREGGKTVLSTPLISGNTVLGALSLGWRTPLTPSPAQIRLAESLAGYAATILENARIYKQQEEARAHAEAVAETLRQREQALSALHEIAVVAGGVLDPVDLGRRVVESARDLLSADGVRLRWWDAETGGLLTLAETEPIGGPAAATTRPGVDAPGISFDTRKTVVVDDYPSWAHAVASSIERGVKSAVSVPLLVGERAVGTLLVRQHTPRTFQPHEVQFLESLAAQVAPALEAARLHVEVRSLNSELEARVEERTAALEAANRELEAFSYSVSHDLRAPLRSMDGFCQVLLEDYGDTLDDQGQQYLQRVRAASQRMAQLIDDLLGLSRLTRTSMQRQPVSLTDLARTVTAELARGAPERDVTFDVQEGLTANGDPQLLRIVLENLLNNAWKFTAKHEQAHIVFRAAPPRDGKSAFCVSDDGAGFDMAYRDKLFGPFQRLHGMTEFEGNGIGLATVQRVINRHGGVVWAEGEPERGARFYFSL